jgi:Ribbon-helix-helix protein, copG family
MYGTTAGTMPHVQKTTVYLPDELKSAIAREARRRGVAEAEVIRSAIAEALERPRPRGALFASDEPLAGRVDELLAGFGER